jgi:hypothetical protein
LHIIGIDQADDIVVIDEVDGVRPNTCPAVTSNNGLKYSKKRLRKKKDENLSQERKARKLKKFIPITESIKVEEGNEDLIETQRHKEHEL